MVENSQVNSSEVTKSYNYLVMTDGVLGKRRITGGHHSYLNSLIRARKRKSLPFRWDPEARFTELVHVRWIWRPLQHAQYLQGRRSWPHSTEARSQHREISAPSTQKTKQEFLRMALSQHSCFSVWRRHCFPIQKDLKRLVMGISTARGFPNPTWSQARGAGKARLPPTDTQKGWPSIVLLFNVNKDATGYEWRRNSSCHRNEGVTDSRLGLYIFFNGYKKILCLNIHNICWWGKTGRGSWVCWGWEGQIWLHFKKLLLLRYKKGETVGLLRLTENSLKAEIILGRVLFPGLAISPSMY